MATVTISSRCSAWEHVGPCQCAEVSADQPQLVAFTFRFSQTKRWLCSKCNITLVCTTFSVFAFCCYVKYTTRCAVVFYIHWFPFMNKQYQTVCQSTSTNLSHFHTNSLISLLQTEGKRKQNWSSSCSAFLKTNPKE